MIIVGKEFYISKAALINSDNHYCSIKCAHQKIDHAYTHSESTNEKIKEGVKKYIKEHPRHSEKIAKVCPICEKEFFVSKCNISKIYCSKQCYLADSAHQFRKTSKGGKRKGSGRGKKGWYKGYFCDSSWELAYVIYNLEHNIKFKRNLEGFDYEFNNKIFKYYPDFVLEDGTFVEIKGLMNEQNKTKISSFKNKLLVLGKTEIIPYLEYAIEKYGKDFIKLYEEK